MCRAWAITHLIPPNKLNFHLEREWQIQYHCYSVTFCTVCPCFWKGLKITPHHVPMTVHTALILPPVTVLKLYYHVTCTYTCNI